MEHLVVAVWRAPGADVESLLETWAPSALHHDTVRACTISFALEDQGRFAAGDPVDALVTLGLTRAQDLDDTPERDALYDVAREVEVWRVDPHRPITGTVPAGTAVKMVSFVRRAEGLTHEQFVRHWTEIHAPLARRHHPGLADYTQNVVRRAFTPGGEQVDGIAELRFANRADFEERFYDSDAGRAAIREDVARFIAAPSRQAALMREVVLRAG